MDCDHHPAGPAVAQQAPALEARELVDAIDEPEGFWTGAVDQGVPLFGAESTLTLLQAETADIPSLSGEALREVFHQRGLAVPVRTYDGSAILERAQTLKKISPDRPSQPIAQASDALHGQRVFAR